LTGIGEISKSALRQNAIGLNVENNPVYGVMTRVKVFDGNKSDLEQKIRNRLSSYSVYHESE
jgi:hypothetical protein